jgi:glycosyltransferase involved in cell wall biosynthesis
MKPPKISVVIPVRNQAHKIEQCLESVFAQSLPPDEVIIVDGHSTDRTVEKVQRFPVKVFYQEYGAAGAARQIGVENATGEYIAFTDADCIPDKDWLKTLLAEFDEGIVGVGGGIEHIGQGFWTKSTNLAFATFWGSARQLQGRKYKNKQFVDWRGIGCFNGMYRREAILAIGGFNVNLLGADETELNRRLLKKGKLLYTPNTVVLHDHGRGYREFAKNMYRYGTWRRQSGVFGLPAIPPLLAPLLALSLIFTRWVFFSSLVIYFIILVSMGFKFAIQEKDLRFIVSIPIAYLTEHTCYTVGFWKEVFFPRNIGKVSGKRPR